MITILLGKSKAYIEVGLYVGQTLLGYGRILYGAHFDGAPVEIVARFRLDTDVRDEHIRYRWFQRHCQLTGELRSAPLLALDDQMTVS